MNKESKDNHGLDHRNSKKWKENVSSNKSDIKLDFNNQNIGSTGLTDGFLNNSVGVNRMNHNRKVEND